MIKKVKKNKNLYIVHNDKIMYNDNSSKQLEETIITNLYKDFIKSKL